MGASGTVPADRRRQTPQVPPKPIVTSPFSTMTGTCLSPLLNFSISSNCLRSVFTSKY